MKTKFIILISSILIFLSAILLYFVFKSYQKTTFLNGNLSYGLTNMTIENFFYSNNYYPRSLQQIIHKTTDSSFSDLEAVNNNINFIFDPYTKQIDSALIYLPLYNRANDHIEGYVLLSRGLDGRKNNMNTKYFLDDYKEMLTVYNMQQMKDATPSTYENVNFMFNPYDYVFGKKDLFLLSWEYRKYYNLVPKPKIDLCSNIDNLNNVLKYYKKDYRRKDYFFTQKKIIELLLNIDGFTGSNNKYEYVIKDYVLFFEMIDPIENLKKNYTKDCCSLIGYLQYIDPNKKEIHFTNCILSK